MYKRVFNSRDRVWHFIDEDNNSIVFGDSVVDLSNWTMGDSSPSSDPSFTPMYDYPDGNVPANEEFFLADLRDPSLDRVEVENRVRKASKEVKEQIKDILETATENKTDDGLPE